MSQYTDEQKQIDKCLAEYQARPTPRNATALLIARGDHPHYGWPGNNDFIEPMVKLAVKGQEKIILDLQGELERILDISIQQHLDEGELHRKIHALSADIDGRIKAGDIIVDQISDLRTAVDMVLESASFHGYPYLPPPQRLMVMLEKVIRGEIKMEDYLNDSLEKEKLN